jgi:alanine dehydrogenase
MIVGIPKESWRDERRVALTPSGAYALAKAGHTVMVQAEAGVGSGFTAEAYRGAGATIVFSPEEVFARADLVVKVMPPTVEECDWMPENKFLFSVVHMGSTNPKIHELLRSRQTMAVGLELMEDAEGRLPVVTAMGEIAGMLLPQIAGRLLESTHGGRGVLLGGVAGIPASRVVIVGAGNVGSTAARVFLGVGANIIVMDDNLKHLRQIEIFLSKAVDTMLATPYNLEHCVRSADVVVGAAMIHGRKTPHVVTDAMVREMPPGSVIIDVAIDHGGCVETSRPTTLSDPSFRKHGVTHYCVPNIPSSVARTASHALSNVVLPLVEQTAESGSRAFSANRTLQSGVYLYRGHCTHEGLAGLLGWECAGAELFQD